MFRVHVSFSVVEGHSFPSPGWRIGVAVLCLVLFTLHGLKKNKAFNEQIMINKQQKHNQLHKREDSLKYSAYVQRINFHFTFSLLFLREINSSQMSRVGCFKPSRILTAGIVSVSMAISYPCSLVAACLGITLRQTWVTLPLRESSIMPIHTLICHCKWFHVSAPSDQPPPYTKKHS